MFKFIFKKISNFFNKPIKNLLFEVTNADFRIINYFSSWAASFILNNYLIADKISSDLKWIPRRISDSGRNGINYVR